jgi:hypothetical protein
MDTAEIMPFLGIFSENASAYCVGGLPSNQRFAASPKRIKAVKKPLLKSYFFFFLP